MDRHMDRTRDSLTVALGVISGMLAAVAPAAGQVVGGAEGPGGAAAWVARVQKELDRASAACKQVAETDAARGLVVSNIDPAVDAFRIRRALLLPGQKVDVVVEVVQSAQQGALYLNLGGPALDLGGQTSALILRVAGRFGIRQMAFSSGVTMHEIWQTVRLVGPSRGFTADEGTSSITIRSTEVGEGAFVSVRVVNDGGLQAVAPAVGIYRMRGDDATTPDPTTRIDLESPAAMGGVVDFGQDVRGRINGGAFTGVGAWVWLNDPRLRVAVRLKDGPLGAGMAANAQNLGTFRAMTIQRRP